MEHSFAELRSLSILELEDGGMMRVRSRHETHSALVLVVAPESGAGDAAGDAARVDEANARALKVRKPVDLGFLDYRTQEKRRAATHAELELGMRTSPWVYEGAWSLLPGRPPRLARSDAGEPVLVMHALDARGRLDHVVRASASGVTDAIDAVSDFCADFHARCPVDSSIDGWGRLDHLWNAWEINFTELPANDPSVPLAPEVRRHLVDDSAHWWRAQSVTLRERVREGRVRDGHGDLRVEHVYMQPRVTLIDPLEFAPHYRFADVAAEVGFLAMELIELERRDLAERFVARYAHASADATLRDVLPFFVRYRAVVRAKVEWIRSTQIQEPKRQDALRRAARLFELAAAEDLWHSTPPL